MAFVANSGPAAGLEPHRGPFAGQILAVFTRGERDIWHAWHGESQGCAAMGLNALSEPSWLFPRICGGAVRFRELSYSNSEGSGFWVISDIHLQKERYALRFVFLSAYADGCWISHSSDA